MTMAGLKQSKRVSWAPGVTLRQVRLFLSEDSPSQSGFGAQDHLQAKPSWLLHATGMASDDSLPPGFEEPHASYQLKKEISQIPLIKWQCPPRIILNPEWLVVAGEECEEVAVENQRQLGVLEAIYPHPSLTPPTPLDSSEAHLPHHDDFRTPLIPIIPIEDEEELDTPSTTDTSEQLQQQSRSMETPAAGAEPGAEPDVMAAASAAFTAIMRSNEEGSLIDRDLLIKILSNPSLIEKLLSECGVPEQTQSPAAPISAPQPLIPPPPPPPLINLSAPLPAPAATHTYTRPSVPAVQFASKPLANAPAVKDMNYYKSLIQQHGEERQAALDLKMAHAPHHYDHHNAEAMNNVEASTGQGLKQWDGKPKIPKPCMYFNGPRGCRNGANCSFQHDASFPQRTDRRKGSKRIKLDREIVGRN